MKYFDLYVSNTTAGTANQLFCAAEKNTGRVFYRISVGGKYKYSLLFSNIIDSTYADGSYSTANRVLDSWLIHACSVCVVKSYTTPDIDEKEFLPLTFSGSRQKTVMPGEFFSTDEVEIETETGDFLCVQLTFSGDTVPYHEELIIPSFRLTENGWTPYRRMPLPCMIGCSRAVRARVAFLGDSITQGIGTAENSYTHWNHVVSELLGPAYAYWNLGIGFGRASDAAGNCSWLFKARQNDLVIVCFGVNDIQQYGDGERIKKCLRTIVSELKKNGCKVIMQTVPPFDYGETNARLFYDINQYIKGDLADSCDAVFDVVPVLGRPDAPHMAQYGGHPNAEGCRKWAEALAPVIRRVLEG